MNEKIKSIANRFLKGALSGAVTSMLLIKISTPINFVDLGNFLTLLLIAGAFGAINGGLLALQKWYSWVE